MSIHLLPLDAERIDRIRAHNSETVRRQTNECRNPFGYQELPRDQVRINWRLIASLIANFVFWGALAAFLWSLG